MVKMRWRRDDEPPDTPATIPITLANIVLILTELGNFIPFNSHFTSDIPVDLLMCWCVDVLMCWCVDVLLCWCVVVLLCCCVDVLMCCCVVVLMCWCVVVLICWCVDVLMLCCVDVLLCCCVDVLMYEKVTSRRWRRDKKEMKKR